MTAIARLRYFHGMGFDSDSNRPIDMLVAVSVGAACVTAKIVESLDAERILSLKNQYGDPTVGDPVEVDRLEIEFEQGGPPHEVTVFNRGLTLMLTDDVDVGRLHRFFGVLEQELGRIG
jgi:hypothetical protein